MNLKMPMEMDRLAPLRLSNMLSFTLKHKLLFCVVCIFLVLRLLLNDLLGVNEADVLPAAKQFLDHRWLPSDWYLNQDIGYRILFNSFIGIPAHFMSFIPLAIAGRFIVILFWAYLLTEVVKALEISTVFIIPLLWIFTTEQSIIAGEWMLRALETKTFAYLALIGTLVFISSRKYKSAALMLGLSLSFHVLVGGYGAIAVLLLMLAGFRDFKMGSMTILFSLLIYTAAASIGVFAVFQNLFSGSDVNKLQAGLIYVNARVPHHVLPSYWLYRGGLWKPVLKLVLSLSVIIPAVIKPWCRMAGITARFALLSMLFAVVGILFVLIGREDLLKFYPFRLPDTVIPFTAYILFFSFLSAEVKMNRLHISNKLVSVVGIAVILLIITQTLYRFTETVHTLIKDPDYYLSRSKPDNPKRILYEWIKNNLPADAVFMVPPNEERFYLTAQRAQFVDYKHSPQSEENILEWYRRLSLYSVNRLQPDGIGFDLDKLNDDYMEISPGIIGKIADNYFVDYYICPLRNDVLYPIVYSSGNWAVYNIRERS